MKIWYESILDMCSRENACMDICRSLPPDRTWHKVKSPKAD